MFVYDALKTPQFWLIWWVLWRRAGVRDLGSPRRGVRRPRYETGMPGNGAVGASYGDLLVTSLIVLGVVCIAAFAVVRLAGRLLATGRVRGGHVLAVVARLPLEPRRSLYVVEVAGKTLLVGTSELGLSLLTELDAGEVRARAVERPSFGELVRAAWLGRRSRVGASRRDDLQGAPVGAAADPRDPVAPPAASDVLEPAAAEVRDPAVADPRDPVAKPRPAPSSGVASARAAPEGDVRADEAR